MTMNNTTKRVASVGFSFAAIGVIVAGSFGVANAVNATAEPVETATVQSSLIIDGTTDNGLAAEQEAEALAAETARIEAERVAAEAAAEEAQRQAAQPAPQQRQTNGGGQQAAPEPAPAPAPGGDQQAGECREYNDAGECTAVYVP